MGVTRCLHSCSFEQLQGDKVRSQVIRMVGESQEAVGAAAGGGSGPGSNKLPTLEEYGTNLTTQANEVSPCSWFIVTYAKPKAFVTGQRIERCM